MTAWRPASFWRETAGRSTCTLCPFACAPDEGGYGRCRVRRRQGEGWETTTFATIPPHWQPIERKPFFHLRPGGKVLTIAAPGCSFRCDYCENAVFSQADIAEPLPFSLSMNDPSVLVQQAMAHQGLIALSYSEPILMAELTLELWQEARKVGVELLWKSNGFITQEALEQVAPALTGVNIDFKTPDPEAHRRLTGGGSLESVLACMSTLKECGVWVEISTPLIPGFNDHEQSIRKMAREILRLGDETPWHLLRYHPDHHRQEPPTAWNTLSRARQIAMDEGLRYVYTTHGGHPDGENTLCPDCGSPVVLRNAATANVHVLLQKNICPKCGRRLSGCW